MRTYTQYIKTPKKKACKFCILQASWFITPRVGFEPTGQNTQRLDNKELTENQKPVLDTGLDILVQKYPELEQIISAWPSLSEQVKQAIIELVRNQK